MSTVRLSLPRGLLYGSTLLVLLATPIYPGAFDMSARAATRSVGFRIVADRLDYSPGAALHLTFLVTNRGPSPLYLFRNLTECSSNRGFASVEVLDERNRNVGDAGCSVDYLPIRDGEIPEMMSDARSWVVLQPNDIYGREVTVFLPTKRGKYKIRAQLHPTPFSERQREILIQNHMNVLEYPILAQPISIRVN